MKIDELMIGDWLLYKSDSLENAFPIQVTREMFNKELVVWKDRFEPIPLTPEVLEKNGFEPIKEGRFPTLKNCYGDILFQLEGIKNEYIRNTLYMFKNIPIFYVHELQHVLKLCKIYKEIVV